jgi:GcrA cell cycle regulator
MTQSTWTPARVELLKSMWAKGLSAATISNRLGDVSRSAVLGKVDRLRLPTHTAEARRTEYCPSGIPSLYSTYVEIEIPMEQRRTLFNLTSKVCHWPVGDPATPDFFFCGAETDARPYCPHHRKVAFTR